MNRWTDLQKEKSTQFLARDPLLLEHDDDTWNALFGDENFTAPMSLGIEDWGMGNSFGD